MAYATDPYRTMRAEDILAFPVGQVMDDRCLLFLWSPWAHLPLAIRTLEAWGFKYSTGCPWLKTARNGAPVFGVGMWFQHCTEVLLLGRRGKWAWGGRTHPSPARRGLFVSVRGRHSEKPEEVAAWIESITPRPRLELFARRHRPGWICWGDQLPPY